MALPAPEPLRVFVVDDSVLYRRVLTVVMEEMQKTGNAVLVGNAGGGVLALQKIPRLQPDLILLDLMMPDMNGLDVLRQLQQIYPHAAVVMVTAATNADADITMQALQLGALDFILKPAGTMPHENHEFLVSEVKRVLPLARAHLIRQRQLGLGPKPVEKPQQQAPAPAPAPRRSAPVVPAATDVVERAGAFELVVLGVSTGGPKALGEVIPLLPASFPCPILIVQHMPEGFTKSLADQLGQRSKIRVREAADGEELAPGTALIARGGHHLIVKPSPLDPRRFCVRFNEGPPENSCRPAVDVLFRSVSEVFPKRVLAVVMTGMGSDGALGVRDLKRRSCYCLVQDEQTSTIFGMPKAVVDLGVADEILPLGDIPGRMTALVERPGSTLLKGLKANLK